MEMESKWEPRAGGGERALLFRIQEGKSSGDTPWRWLHVGMNESSATELYDSSGFTVCIIVPLKKITTDHFPV